MIWYLRKSLKCVCSAVALLTCLLVCAATPLLADESTLAAATAPADTEAFEDSVYRILRQHCVDCHGEDSQEGQLRLDARRTAMQGGVSGPAIVAGTPEESLVIRRLLSADPDLRMPFGEDALPQDEIELLRKWISDGAHWPDGIGADIPDASTHWAYVAPKRPRIPEAGGESIVHNAIDAFVIDRLRIEDLHPSGEASKSRLLRRAALDLTGVAPSLGDVDEFLADERPDAFERQVDRLLASPRYGERWAVPWLDAARYADSNGYQRDGRRDVWAFRDWVIRALNSDMPFDQFTIEQLAGDLLPNATIDQKIATGFHRGTMANVEAGTDAEEERVLAVIDRVNTTGTVWLGSTIECAQCHSHKYDPFSQREYYQLFAFFNSTEAEIDASARSTRQFTGPKMELPESTEATNSRSRTRAEIDQLTEKMRAIDAEFRHKQQTLAVSLPTEANRWTPLGPVSATSSGGTTLTVREDTQSVLASGTEPRNDTYELLFELPARALVTAIRLEALTHESLPAGGPGRVKPGNFVLNEVSMEWISAGGQSRTLEVADAFADYSQLNYDVKGAVDGDPKTAWAVGGETGKPHAATLILTEPVQVASDAGTLRIRLEQNFGRTRTLGHIRLSITEASAESLSIPEAIVSLLLVPAAERTTKQKQDILTWQREVSDEYSNLQTERDQKQKSLDEIGIPTTLVMREMDETREARILKRGDFLNPGDIVSAGTPAALHEFPADGPMNRLGLARWLVSAENPLTGRVTANRHWLAFFGKGLVSTPEDFGQQGERPTHPELLDWLATEFVRSGWSVKQLHRRIVTSATYRQSAKVRSELLDRDPANVLYARGPRHRLSAELIRDHLLATGGLASDRMFGPPVFPVQPDGVWNHSGVASNKWETSTGEDAWRRGLYTYWRRTCYYPGFAVFDAPSRESCVVSRQISNTPLQALTLMNDPVCFEAAAGLAARMLTESGNGATDAAKSSTTDRTCLEYGFRLATGRLPETIEIDILAQRLNAERDASRHDQDSNSEIAKRHRPPETAASEFAVWVRIANILLNLDETLSR